MGLSAEYSQVPSQATFTNLKKRLGKELYNQIFHALVEVAELLGFLFYKILSTDGTLFPANARYKGFTYFCNECNSIEFKGIIENIKRRILYRLNNLEKIVPGKEICVRAKCPSPNFPDDVNPPKVELLTLSLESANPEKSNIFNQIVGLKEELQTAGLDLVVKRGVLTKVVMGDDTDSFFFRCPKIPADMDGRIGVRRDPQNPNRNITAAALKNRGYDRNSWPYAPCEILTRPNGFDFNCQKANFSCRRQCLSSKDPRIV